ncbi:MAG: hypothetical protein PHU64_04295 [Candidatus Omnitrophica bacterium]|nr:hypothetical protein [Candidatus Omnitrophota bacterium]MDD5429914.1 hypothetical protein [Candidatus Omnitrophota bacterium]
MNTDSKKLRKKLLISWGNPYIFYEAILPLLPKLAKNFRVSVILQDTFALPKIFETLSVMAKEGVIEEYWKAPDNRQMLKKHLFIKSKLKIWRSKNFDVFLSGSMVQSLDRYLLECVLPDACVRVCLWTALTYLLLKEDFAKQILFGRRKNHEFPKRTEQNSKRTGFFRKLLMKIKNSGSLPKFLKIIIWSIKDYVYNVIIAVRKKINIALDRYLFPKLLAGKIFPLDSYAEFTQIASEKSSDIFIFCDEVEKKVFQGIFKKAKAYVAKYPAQGACRCKDFSRKNKAILVPVTTGFSGRFELSEEKMSLFYRDIKATLFHTGAEVVHLRRHPRDRSRWADNLQKYLQDRGIKVECVGYERPIREIMCDYIGMAGFASSALRDARACCDYAFVVGFTAISKNYVDNPEFLFGDSDGIGWIKDDGSFNPVIFERNKYNASDKKTIEEILLELTDEKSVRISEAIAQNC